MLGAIAGDIIGLPYERWPTKDKHFPLFSDASCFSDDTVPTVAIADALLHEPPYPFTERLKFWYRCYPHAGYGKIFAKWAAHPTDVEPYGSWGNGSAMRVSPVGWSFSSLEETLRVAATSAAVTHDHAEGIAGAQAVAGCIFLARDGADRSAIRAFAERFYGERMREPLDDLRARHTFDVSCIGSVPPAIIAFLEATDFEDGVRNAVSLGGDSDTQAAIAGAIGEAFFGGVPAAIAAAVRQRLDEPLQQVLDQFTHRLRSGVR